MWLLRMKLHQNRVEFSQLNRRLRDCLQKEKEIWQPRIFRSAVDSAENSLSPELRDEMACWLMKLTDKYNFHPETYALSIGILDHFLSLVKVSRKYIRCITVTCFYLAAKIQEEDEVIPGTKDFVSGTRCDCSVSEVLRMERIILDKFQWNLKEATSLDFLHIFHSLLLSCEPHLLDSYSHMTAEHQLSALTTKLKLCLTHHQLSSVRPAIVALALISLELESYTSDWLASTVMLQRWAMVDCRHVVYCREVISRCLSQYRYRNIVYRYSPEAMNKRAKRKVSESDVDYYDGIKRLYSEDEAATGTDDNVSTATAASGASVTCAAEVRHDCRHCPILQSVEAT